MSALQQSTSTFDRRNDQRVQVSDGIVVHLGRSEGVLVDIGPRGARVRHVSPVGRGAKVRLAFEWKTRHFAATATVLASRIVALDGPTYESRLHFTHVTDESSEVLQEILELLENGELRRAVENLRGLTEGEPSRSGHLEAQGFFRCRYFSSGRWEKKWTREPLQPDEGFTLPASLTDFEVAQVCRSYERIDENARYLLRMIAQTIIEERAARGRR